VTKGFSINRRRLLQGAAAVGLASAAGAGSAFAATGPVRFGIYGSATKLATRGKAVARYQELHPEVQVVFEGVPSDAWPDKIAAMVAGGNAPDQIALAQQDLGQYASRGALAPLDGYIGNLLNADAFDKSVLDLGRTADGKLYGLPIAVSVQGLGYNQSALERLKLPQPPAAWSLAEFADLCAQVHKANPKIYGSHDHGGHLVSFQMQLVADGRHLFGEESLMTSADEVAAWLDFWAKMRSTGGAVPPDLQTQFNNSEFPNAPLNKGTAVFAVMQSQDISSGYQALQKDTLGMTAPASAKAGGNNGVYPNASSLVTMNAKSQFKDETMKLMNWFVTDPESAKVLGLVSGPPASKTELAEVMKMTDIKPIDSKVLTYSLAALKSANPAPPSHRAERVVTDLLIRTNESVAFGSASIKDAAKQFISEGNDLMKHA
jgi:multiple sugar transport system substrate-binding protein